MKVFRGKKVVVNDDITFNIPSNLFYNYGDNEKIIFSIYKLSKDVKDSILELEIEDIDISVKLDITIHTPITNKDAVKTIDMNDFLKSVLENSEGAVAKKIGTDGLLVHGNYKKISKLCINEENLKAGYYTMRALVDDPRLLGKNQSTKYNLLIMSSNALYFCPVSHNFLIDKSNEEEELVNLVLNSIEIEK